MLISKTNFTNLNQSNNPNFGMALHLDANKIARKIGEEAASRIKNVTPSLDALAKDVDIFIEPAEGKHLTIRVQKLTPSFDESKNTVLNFFRKIKRQIQIINKDFIGEEISLGDNIETKIVKETAYLKGLLKNNH